MSLTLAPVTLRAACFFVDCLHRHHKAPQGYLWAHSVIDETGAIAGVAMIEEEAAPLKSKEPRRLPVTLPEEVAVEMVKTYQANARDGIKGQIAGMQAAYRLFLDRVEL